ncbi:hypothetical protein [Nocardia inohanensis]|uniref:hypothetical protein n=1 Tax=Nocardia inohanensis TaxID=209246 RepID=UPI00082B5CF2|nr:hypothetical protein [Nocardia inohanensis]
MSTTDSTSAAEYEEAGYPVQEVPEQRRARGFTALPAGILAMVFGILGVMVPVAHIADPNTEFTDALILIDSIMAAFFTIYLIGGMLLLIHRSTGRYLLIANTVLVLVGTAVSYLRGTESSNPLWTNLLIDGVVLLIGVLAAVPATGRWIAAGRAARQASVVSDAEVVPQN